MAESTLGHILFLAYIFWLPLLAFAVTPAMLTGWICAWRMTGIGWRSGSLAGLGGGNLGVALAIAWYFLALAFQRYEQLPLLFGYGLVPILSVAAAWALCRLWSRLATTGTIRRC